MNKEQIYIGNIKKCTKYDEHNIFTSKTYINGECVFCDGFGHIEVDDELYKENAVLIKLNCGGYVDIEKVNTLLDYIKIYYNNDKKGFRLDGFIMPTSAHGLNRLFVDEDSLVPYYSKVDKTKEVSIRKLQKEIKNK